LEENERRREVFDYIMRMRRREVFDCILMRMRRREVFDYIMRMRETRGLIG